MCSPVMEQRQELCRNTVGSSSSHLPATVLKYQKQEQLKEEFILDYSSEG